MTTGDRLKELRQKANLTLQDAGELIGTSKQNLFKYENDIITNIPIDRLVKLAEIYNTSPIEILGWEHYSNNPNSTKASVYNYLPYGVSAGIPDGPNYEVDLEKIEISDSVMGPYANDDDILVKMNYPIYNLEDEDIVVFSNNGEYSLKLFFRDGEDIIFRPASTYHSFTDFKFSKDDEFSILGKVVMYCVNL